MRPVPSLSIFLNKWFAFELEQMASSSSSHQKNPECEPAGKRTKVCESSRLYDVFINHRGPDVKETLVTQLYNSLQQLEIEVFLDSEEKELGNSFPSIIETAICSAKVHIAIFSKRFAESAWCLNELLLMLENTAKIIPVFYQVDPWELRYIEKGIYSDAFMTYKNKGEPLDRLEKWREALRDVSFTTGLSQRYCDDSSLCKKLVSAVLRELQKQFHTAKYPVGLDELVEDFEISCDLMKNEKERVKLIGIFGMGGVGKTTLAKELFNRKHTKYEAASFIFDVRDASAEAQLPSLQKKLLKDLLHEAPPKSFNVMEGVSFLRHRLEKRRSLSFLVVLDDIDNVDQLHALMVMNNLKHARNSLIIITTRDKQVLERAGISNGYHLKEMNRNFARELFCWYALRQPSASSGYKDLVEAFLDTCGGLPLSLQVLGGDVHGKTRDYWQLQLETLSHKLPREIEEELRISFDTLDSEEKQVFMDTACFFVDKPKSLALRVWEGSGWNALHALQTLKDKCLVEEIEHLSWNGPQWHDNRAVFRMHGHLRLLGKKMANELKSPPRVWRPQDLEELKEEFRNIIENTSGRCFHSIFDKSMGSQITFFLENSNDYNGKTTSLLWLELDLNWNVHTSIPSWIPLHNLQCLRIRSGHLKRLWQSDLKPQEAPFMLKELQLSGIFMEECPNLSGISNHLEKLVLNAEEMPVDGWSLLESLGVRLRGLVLSEDTLSGELASNNRRESKSLVVSNFKLRGTLALISSVSDLNSLEKIEISKQNLVSVILISGNHYNNIKSLELYHMENLFQLDLSCLTKLKNLKLKYCNKLKTVSGVSDLANLEVLDICQCPELNGLPSLSGLDCLERVAIDKCTKLDFLELKGCKNLKALSGMSYLAKLLTLRIFDCPRIEELPTFALLSCLKTIEIDECEKLACLDLYCCENLKTVSGMSNLMKLEELTICDCTKLEELPSLAHLNVLRRITITECRTLQSIALPTSDLTELVTLTIVECPELKELSLSRLSCLQTVTINRCEKLQDITGIEELQRLKHMQLSMGNNVAVRNCINRLQRVPSEFMTTTGRARHGADSITNINLFSELKGTGAASKIPTEKDGSGFVEASLDLLEIMPESGSLSAIILCAVVVVEDSCEDSLYIGLRGRGAVDSWIFEEVLINTGEWIVTLVITDQMLIARYIEDPKLGTVEITLDEPRGIKKAWIQTVNKGEEWRTLHVLNTIVELYDK